MVLEERDASGGVLPVRDQPHIERGDDVRQSDVFALLLQHGVRFELVYGGIEEVQGDTFGNLTLALDGEPGAVDAALDDVRALVPVKELVR